MMIDKPVPVFSHWIFNFKKRWMLIPWYGWCTYRDERPMDWWLKSEAWWQKCTKEEVKENVHTWCRMCGLHVYWWTHGMCVWDSSDDQIFWEWKQDEVLLSTQFTFSWLKDFNLYLTSLTKYHKKVRETWQSWLNEEKWPTMQHMLELLLINK